MSWLFSRALVQAYENSHSSPEPVEEYSVATFADGEPYAQWNVMPTPQGFWRNDKMMESSRLSQFGPTLRLLTADHGEAVLTSFLEVFPVRTYRLQDKDMESKASVADYGKNLSGWYAKYDLGTCSWKTAQCSLIEGSESFSETWPKSGLMLNGKCYPLPTVAHGTKDKESGLWPTLTVHGNYNRKWASKTSGDGLASAITKMPTLVARDYRSPGRSRMERTGGKQGECLPQIVGGPLNPEWCEWYMGFPSGWTELGPLAMPKFREWQQQHSICCQEASCE